MGVNRNSMKSRSGRSRRFWLIQTAQVKGIAERYGVSRTTLYKGVGAVQPLK
jgi:hypothetical protein